MTALPVDALARKAASQARRLDEREAPSREIARQEKKRADGLAVAEKASRQQEGLPALKTAHTPIGKLVTNAATRR